MAFGIANTIRWFLGLDEELEKLMHDLKQAKDSAAQEIASLRTELDKSKTECNTQVEQLKEANKKHISKTENDFLAFHARLNVTSEQIANLTSIVQPSNVPLLTAPFWNYTEVVAAKLKSGAYKEGKFGYGALVHAYMYGSIELIELLNKLKVGFSNTNDQTCDDHVCLAIKNMQMMGLFAKDVIKENNMLRKSVSLWEDIIIHLLENGLDPSSNITSYDNLMMLAAANGYLKLIIKLNELGVSVNFNGTERGSPKVQFGVFCPAPLTPLTSAVKDNNIITTAKLIDLGANMYAEDMYGRSAITYHKKCGNENSLIDTFLYIVQELQAAYVEDQNITLVGIQSDGNL